MRVLIWSEPFWPSVGGIEVFLGQLIGRLRTGGHVVEVMTATRRPDRPDEDVLDGVPVHRLPLYEALASREPGALIALRRAASRIIATFGPDLTHVNLVGPGGALLLDQSADVGRVVVTVHVTLERLRSASRDTLFGRTVDRADWITGCSQAALDRVIALAPQARARASVMPHGAAIPDLPETTPPFGPPHLVAIGRLVPMKGFDIAIDALARIVTLVPDVRLTIAGDGPERAALEAQAARLGLAGRVTFLGWQSRPEIFALLMTATVVVIPSRTAGVEYSEGLGLVAVEAAAAGRAVVATTAGGLPETIVDGVTGVLVAPDDSAVLAAAIDAVLKDPHRAIAMGRAGRARYGGRDNDERALDAFEHLFQRMVG